MESVRLEWGKIFLFPGKVILPLCVCLMTVSCSQKREERVIAPWGAVSGDTVSVSEHFDLDRIVSNGEMIMLTLSGPESYYDYRGRMLGIHYMLCQKFADKIGVSLRVEVCKDTADMLRKLIAGDADVIAYPLREKKIPVFKSEAGDVMFCGVCDSSKGSWLVSSKKPMLVKALNDWYEPSMLAKTRQEESFLLSARSVVRHVYSPMLSRQDGVISRYDALFISYCQSIRWDWRLMAAQCYQESTFDAQAKSWAGARGLMQIMPATAAHLGLPLSKIHDPESNIAAAAKYIKELEDKFSDISDRRERISFVLASYNGGYHHIRDAMALAGKNRKDSHKWSDVAKYVLLLSEPEYYRDPAVRHGYMRGSETVDYVTKIHKRWMSYRGVRSHGVGIKNPRKAKHNKKKYKLQRE